MNVALAHRMAIAYCGFMLLCSFAGALQAVWLASRGQHAEPLSTVGGVISLTMAALLIPILGGYLVWFAVRGFWCA